jgi:hypothetical protein
MLLSLVVIALRVEAAVRQAKRAAMSAINPSASRESRWLKARLTDRVKKSTTTWDC